MLPSASRCRFMLERKAELASVNYQSTVAGMAAKKKLFL